METHETHVSIETAKLLKQAGFDWTCENGYLAHSGLFTSGHFSNNSENGIAAPTLDVAQKWLRDIKNCQVEIMYMYDKYGINMGKYIGIYTVQDRIHGSLADEESEQPIKLFEVYEKAQEALEQKILTILLEEEQQNEETNLV